MSSSTFVLGATEFYEYHSGRDSRGVESHTYMIDKHQVGYDAYWATLVKTLQGMGAYDAIRLAVANSRSAIYPLEHYIGKQ